MKDKIYYVKEIFTSLQGEGGRCGELSTFIRFAGCNLKCSYCDTDFAKGVPMVAQEILEQVQLSKSKWIIWTGGEPTLQLNTQLLLFFKNKGYFQAIETNGTKSIPRGIDYVTISPKVSAQYLRNLHKNRKISEIRLPIASEKELSFAKKYLDMNAENYYLSPIFDPKSNILDDNILSKCLSYIMQNPQWKLSTQNHKLWNIQ